MAVIHEVFLYFSTGFFATAGLSWLFISDQSDARNIPRFLLAAALTAALISLAAK